MIGLEMLGRRPAPRVYATGEHVDYIPNDTVVMFPTNGVGFGHFTRMLALAKRMKKLDSSLEIIFFTTMPTLHLLKPHGIAAHHISGPKYFDHLETDGWNALLEEELTICIETHRPKMFIFDGAYPYRGMLNAIKNRIGTTRFWVRRINRRGKENAPIDAYSHFEKIVVPGDLIDANMEDMAKLPIDEIVMTPPMLSVSRSDLNERGHLRSRLGIPPEGYVALVSSWQPA